MDMIYPPYSKIPSAELMQIVEKAPVDQRLRVWIEGEDQKGNLVKKGKPIALGAAGTAIERLGRYGLLVVPSGDQFDVATVKLRSRAQKIGFEQGQKITEIEVENDRPNPQWMFIPTLGVLGLIFFLQRRRVAVAAQARA
jgi:hypothetical protein